MKRWQTGVSCHEWEQNREKVEERCSSRATEGFGEMEGE